MTAEELEAARAARRQALLPTEFSQGALRRYVRELGFATLPELEAWCVGAPASLQESLGVWLGAELAEHHAVEVNLWPGLHRYIPVELIEFCYVAVGDRNPRRDYKRQADQRKLSWLAAEVYEKLLGETRPVTSAELRDAMGAERTSILAIERALEELAATLKVARVGRTPEGNSQWRPLGAIVPGLPQAWGTISLVQAAAALVTQWLDVEVCATEEALADFFAPLFSRSRVHAALVGLEGGARLTLESLDGRRAYRLKSLAPPSET